MSAWEEKRADRIVLGDYLPYRFEGEPAVWPLEVVKVEKKRTRVWITVEEPASGDRFVSRPRFADVLRFKEGATIVEEAVNGGDLL